MKFFTADDSARSVEARPGNATARSIAARRWPFLSPAVSTSISFSISSRLTVASSNSSNNDRASVRPLLISARCDRTTSTTRVAAASMVSRAEASETPSETSLAETASLTLADRSRVHPSRLARLLIAVWEMPWRRPISDTDNWPARYSRSIASQSVGGLVSVIWFQNFGRKAQSWRSADPSPWTRRQSAMQPLRGTVHCLCSTQ